MVVCPARDIRVFLHFWIVYDSILIKMYDMCFVLYLYLIGPSPSVKMETLCFAIAVHHTFKRMQKYQNAQEVYMVKFFLVFVGHNQ